MSRPPGKLEFNHELLRGSPIKDPYGNTVTLMVLYDTGPRDNSHAFYVQGDMYEPGDIRQFIVLAPSQAAAIHVYDLQLQREHKLAAKARFDRIAKADALKPGEWENYTQGQTFPEWFAAQLYGRWNPERNFTPDVCIQLTSGWSPT